MKKYKITKDMDKNVIKSLESMNSSLEKSHKNNELVIIVELSKRILNMYYDSGMVTIDENTKSIQDWKIFFDEGLCYEELNSSSDFIKIVSAFYSIVAYRKTINELSENNMQKSLDKFIETTNFIFDYIDK